MNPRAPFFRCSALAALAPLAALGALAMLVSACGNAGAPSSAMPMGDEPRAASVWRSKCGSCHAPVEPGSRKRAEIESAMQRHRKRLHLSDEQWSQLVEFLAPEHAQQANAR